MFYKVTSPEALEYLKHKEFLAHTDAEDKEELNIPSYLRNAWFEDNR